jgi:TolA-binding protein
MMAIGLIWVASTSSLAQTPGAPQAPAAKTDPPRVVPPTLNFANGLYRNRQYDLAAEEYDKFLKTGKPNAPIDLAEAWFGLGSSRFVLGRYPESRQAFEAFLKVAPDHPVAPVARFRIGEAAYLLGDLTEARGALEAYLASGDRRYREAAWSHLGDIGVRANDLPAARKAYENALMGNPQGSLANRARLGLGRVLAAMNAPDDARKVLRELAEKGGPDWLDKAWLQLARVETSEGRWADGIQALDALETAAPRSPLVVEARILKAEALGKLDRHDEAEALLGPIAADPSQPLAAQAADRLGASLLARGKADEALAQLDKAASRAAGTPLGSRLAFRAAEAALASGKTDEARSRFLKLAEADPKAAYADDAQLRAASLALDARDFAEARKQVAAFLVAFPDSPLKADARLVDAKAALGLEQPKEAIAILNASLAEDHPTPATAEAASFTLGLAYQKDGQGEKAGAMFSGLAKATTAGGAGAQYLLGQAEFEAGRFAPAVEILDQYLTREPQGKYADHALARVAQSQWELGQHDKAVETLNRLATSFPRSETLPPARLRLAESALSAKEYDRAGELFRLAADAAPPALKPRALSGLGWSLLQGGHPAEAAPVFATLVEQSPDDPLAPEAAAARGRALEEAGKLDEALVAYAFVLEKYAKTPQAGPTALAVARGLSGAKRFEDAAKAYERVVTEFATSSGEPVDSVLAEWGWSLVDAGKAAEADAVFERILKEFADSPKAADARFNLAESAFAARDYARVGELLAPVVAEGSKAGPALVAPSLYRQGRARAELKDWAGASSAFGRLVAEFPDAPIRREGRFWKAESSFQGGDARAAEAEFAALAAEPPAPGDPKGLVATAKARRVECLVQLERWADALPLAETFLTEEPSDPLHLEVEYAHGRALQGLARFDDARAAFDRVIQGRERSDLAARAQFMKGESYFHQREYREAIREYWRVVLQYEAPKWQALALLQAGKVHEALDEWSKAAETYEKLQQPPYTQDPSAEEARKRLDAVRKRLAGGGEPSRG